MEKQYISLKTSTFFDDVRKAYASVCESEDRRFAETPHIRFVEEHEVEKLLDLADDYVSNGNYNRKNFEKYLADKSPKQWVGLFDRSDDNGKPLALAVLKPFPEHFQLVAELQSFVSGHGHGRRLLEWMVRAFENLWLACDVDGGDKLLNFYRSIKGLAEYRIPHSIFYAERPPQSFFYKAKRKADTFNDDEKRILAKFNSFIDNGDNDD